MMLRQRRTIRLLIGLTLGLALGALAAVLSAPQAHLTNSLWASQMPASSPVATPVSPPQYQAVTLPHSTVHVVTIANPQAYPVRVSVPDGLVPVDQMALRLNALAALNAGFFDPNNGLTTSNVVVDGDPVADPRQNPRLMENPDLTSYLDQILNRSEFRRYECGGQARYDISLHSSPVPSGCALVDAVGAGPQLLPQNTSYEEAFIDYGATGAINRDALGSRSRNARSAVGLKPDGSVVLVMAAQEPGAGSSGMTFADMIDFLQSQGVEKALNLDGGSSSTLIYQGTVHHGRLDSSGNRVRRPVKAILWVGDAVSE